MEKNGSIIIIGILLLVFASRLAYSVVAARRLDSLVISDMRTYNLLAGNLMERGIYGIEEGPVPWRSYRPPLYPFFLSLVYRLIGFNHPVARVIQAILASFSGLLLFLIGRELCGSAVGLLAAFLFSIDFSLIHLSGLFFSENLYLPLSLLIIWFLIKGMQNLKISSFIGAGFIGGLAALCRPIVIPFLILIGLAPMLKLAPAFFRVRRKSRRLKRLSEKYHLIKFWRHCEERSDEAISINWNTTHSDQHQRLLRPGGARNDIIGFFGQPLKSAAANVFEFRGSKLDFRQLRGWLLMLLVAGITISPWTIRNYRIHHRFVPISTNGGVMLWMGLHHGAPGDYHFPEENNPLYSIKDEVEKNRVGYQESIKFIFQYPGEFLRLAGKKFRQFWGFYFFTKSGKQWLIFMALGVAGFFLSLRNWRRWLVLYIYIFSFTGVHLLVHSGYRYRLPLHPLVELWAALFLIRIWDKIFRRKILR